MTDNRLVNKISSVRGMPAGGLSYNPGGITIVQKEPSRHIHYRQTARVNRSMLAKSRRV
jgi:hypothetical protein